MSLLPSRLKSACIAGWTIVQVRLAGVGSRSPNFDSARTSKVCAPTARPLKRCVPAQEKKLPSLSSLHSNVTPSAFEANVKLAVPCVVRLPTDAVTDVSATTSASNAATVGDPARFEATLTVAPRGPALRGAVNVTTTVQLSAGASVGERLGHGSGPPALTANSDATPAPTTRLPMVIEPTLRALAPAFQIRNVVEVAAAPSSTLPK